MHQNQMHQIARRAITASRHCCAELVATVELLTDQTLDHAQAYTAIKAASQHEQVMAAELSKLRQQFADALNADAAASERLAIRSTTTAEG